MRSVQVGKLQPLGVGDVLVRLIARSMVGIRSSNAFIGMATKAFHFRRAGGGIYGAAFITFPILYQMYFGDTSYAEAQSALPQRTRAAIHDV